MENLGKTILLTDASGGIGLALSRLAKERFKQVDRMQIMHRMQTMQNFPLSP